MTQNPEIQNVWIEPLQPDERSTLESFCEAVTDLTASPLYQKLLQENVINSDLEIRDGVVVGAVIRDLDENDLKSFLLTARLFSQKNDRISVHNVAKIINRRASEEFPLSFNFNQYRLAWKKFGTQTVAKTGDTLEHIFDVFLYGHYAHKSAENAATYRKWQSSADKFIARKSAFLISLGAFFWTVQGMEHSVRQLLACQPVGPD